MHALERVSKKYDHVEKDKRIWAEGRRMHGTKLEIRNGRVRLQTLILRV